jgi:hypothetical protein
MGSISPKRTTADRILPEHQIVLNGIPFHTAACPPPLKVGTPDSAEIPAPVSAKTLAALSRRFLNAVLITGELFACIRDERPW